MPDTVQEFCPLGIETPDLPPSIRIAGERIAAEQAVSSRLRQPHLYIFIFAVWATALSWFHPRLASLLNMAYSPLSWGALAFFVAFTELAWLYAFYNVGVIVFAAFYRARYQPGNLLATLPLSPPAVAILYTTCNDFVEESALSCLAQDYSNFTVYILDDSNDAALQGRVDRFASEHKERVQVVRRPNRHGFKAGNLNYGLGHAATKEPLFALVDADEVLPRNFLRRLVPRVIANDRCGFVQANHESNPNPAHRSPLGNSMGIGVDIHWRWYQPLRNRYGFVMLLGHGAVLRRTAWEEVGGFPEIVSEDLAFAVRLRDRGWHGQFATDVICYEDFPETVRDFRVRHMKWTRGTCEFLSRELGRLVRSPNISIVEKLDILLPTLSLPLSLLYFLFVVDANLVLPVLFSHPHPLTIAFGRAQFILPMRMLHQGFGTVSGADFFLITLLTLVAPILCFVLEMAKRPRALFRFVCQSTALYGALGPLSCVGVVFYVLTGKAVFHVTADRGTQEVAGSGLLKASAYRRLIDGWRKLLVGSHPDHPAVQGFEVLCALVFGIICIPLFQVSFFGLTLAFLLLPVLHHVGWESPVMQRLVYVPFTLVLLGLLLGGLSLLGVQTLWMGYGFHF